MPYPELSGTLSGTIRNGFPDSKRGRGWTTAASDDPRSRAPSAPRRLRADAQRNVDALLEAAKAVFATSGVDAPAKEIADLAGVGVGTLYRHFPQRSDLVMAVLEREIDACADAAPALSAAHEPAAALAKWLHRYTEFLATKRGLASALHSGDPAFEACPATSGSASAPPSGHCSTPRRPSGEIRADVSARTSCTPSPTCACPCPDEGADYSQRMVALLVDGLRYGATSADPRMLT